MKEVKLKIDNERDFIEVQKLVFENGGTWFDGTTDLVTFDEIYKNGDSIYGVCVSLSDIDYSGNQKLNMTFIEFDGDFNEIDAKEVTLNELKNAEDIKEVIS